MDGMQIANEILQKNEDLDKIRATIKDRVNAKAKAMSGYDKKIAIVLIMLKNGEEMAIDGHITKNPPTTVCEKIAKGLCWREKLEMEQAIGACASATSNLDVLKSQLIGLQSIYKHLDSMG